MLGDGARRDIEKEALHILRKDDRERKRWTKHLYGIDTSDSNLYDLVIHIDDAAPGGGPAGLTLIPMYWGP